MKALAWASAMALASTIAFAQENHAAGHNEYQGWASRKTGNCCSNQDCGILTQDKWRNADAGTEVKIDDQWCPVEYQHFIFRGKSPDASHAHACVRKHPIINGMPVKETQVETCDRLLCFVGEVKS